MFSNAYGELNVATKTAAYTTTGDGIRTYFCDPSGGAFDFTIASEDFFSGSWFYLINKTTSANAVTVKTENGTINGVAGATGLACLNASREACLIVCDGTNWYANQMAPAA